MLNCLFSRTRQLITQLCMRSSDRLSKLSSSFNSVLETNSVEQSHFWEDNRYSTSKKNLPHSVEPRGSLLCWQEPTTGLYPEPHEFSSHTLNPSLRYLCLLSSHLQLSFANSLFPSSLLNRILYEFFSVTFVQHAPHISSSLILTW
jgi:hypothetical protein